MRKLIYLLLIGFLLNSKAFAASPENAKLLADTQVPLKPY